MLTDADIRAAKPSETAYDLTDGDGLELRVHPSGAKAWRFSYRLHGRRRRVPLGRYPDVKLGAARKAAAILRGRVAKGEDPAAERAREREAIHMVDLFGAKDAEGWYLTTYVLTAGKLGTAKTAKGIECDRYQIAKHLRRRRGLMRKRVSEVTKADIERIKADVPPSVWRKVRNMLLVAFRHAEEIGAIPPGSNPAARTNASTDAKRERFLTPDERKRLAATLDELETLGPKRQKIGDDGKPYGGLSAHLVRALRLLVLTGMRRSEVLKLKWEDVDTRASCLRIVGKTGRRVVPLTPQALSFLKSQRQAAGRAELVCCTEDGSPIHPDNVGRAWRSARKVAKLEGVRLHDLRHSWASDAVSAGVPLYIVGKALGHTQPNTTARYAHLHDDAIKDGLAKAGAAIEAATKGGK